MEVAFREGRTWLDGEDVSEALRAEEVGVAASRVAAVPAVREALLDRQRGFRARSGAGRRRPRHGLRGVPRRPL